MGWGTWGVGTSINCRDDRQDEDEEEVPREGVANWRDAVRGLAQKELKLVTILAVECRLRKATNMVPFDFARREGSGRPRFPSVWILGSRNAGSPGPRRLAASTLWDSKLSNPLPPPWARVRLKLAPANGISIVFMDAVVALLHSCV